MTLRSIFFQKMEAWAGSKLETGRIDRSKVKGTRDFRGLVRMDSKAHIKVKEFRELDKLVDVWWTWSWDQWVHTLGELEEMCSSQKRNAGVRYSGVKEAWLHWIIKNSLRIGAATYSFLSYALSIEFTIYQTLNPFVNEETQISGSANALLFWFLVLSKLYSENILFLCHVCVLQYMIPS